MTCSPPVPWNKARGCSDMLDGFVNMLPGVDPRASSSDLHRRKRRRARLNACVGRGSGRRAGVPGGRPRGGSGGALGRVLVVYGLCAHGPWRGHTPAQPRSKNLGTMRHAQLCTVRVGKSERHVPVSITLLEDSLVPTTMGVISASPSFHHRFGNNGTFMCGHAGSVTFEDQGMLERCVGAPAAMRRRQPEAGREALPCGRARAPHAHLRQQPAPGRRVPRALAAVARRAHARNQAHVAAAHLSIQS